MERELPSLPLIQPPFGLELLRRAFVIGCALCLVAAGQALPALGL